MDENHQDTAGSKLIVTDNKLWIPPLSPKDQKKLDRLRKKPFAQRMGFADKTLWDWINLLGVFLIPIVIAAATIWFSVRQNETSLLLSKQQHDSDQKVALDQQRETTLRTYMDDIKDLLLNRGLATSKPKDEVRVVARAETLTALRQLDGERKGRLIQFLSEAALITSLKNGDINFGSNVIIDLRGADLRDADLNDTGLSSAHLSNASLSNASLSNASLVYASLSNASLSNAFLNDADLSDAHLSHAYLGVAFLNYANLSNASLGGVNLSSADLSNANLSSTTLRGADLSSANLSRATLVGADLRGADLRGADLSDVNLKGARYNTKEITKEIPITDQGHIIAIVQLPPTQWPQGFDPDAAGVTCVDC